MVRPSDLPIYEDPEEVLDFEYHGKERTFLEENVGVVRKEIEGVLGATRSVRERAVEIYETSKAHTMATVDYITDEENILPRAGAITVGGLAGLVIGARKKGGFFKKVLYTSTGIVSAASLCYPRQAYQISQNMYGNAKDYAAIGYNFVVGVKPQSKILTQAEPKKVPLAHTIQDVTPEPTEEEVPPATPASTTGAEGAEVRSVMPQVMSHKTLSTPFDTLAQQASDITLWGFRLIDKSSTGSRSPTDLVVPAKPSVPEGFGSVEGTNRMVTESTAEVISEEVHHPENVANIENERSSTGQVEDIVHIVAEKVADFVEEKTAGVVIEAAHEVENDASKIAATAEVVEELGSKVESVLNVAKNVSEAATKAAHYTPGVPEPIIEKIELVTEIVEEAGKVVDNVTSIAESVEEVAKEVKRETEDIESQASEVIQSKKKREEIFEKVVDFVIGTESPSSDEVKETSIKLPDSSIKNKKELQKISGEIISEEPADLLEFAITDKKGQIQNSETEIKDTSYLDTELKGLAPKSSEEPKSSSDSEEKDDSKADQLLVAQKEPVINNKLGSLEKIKPFYKIISFFSKEDKDISIVEKVEEPFARNIKGRSTGSGMTTESEAAVTKETPEEYLQGEAKMKVNESKTISASAVTKFSEDEAKPNSIGEVLQPVIEGIAKDVAEDVADDAMETISEAVKETARDVQEAVSGVVKVMDIVEDVDKQIVTVLDAIQEASEEAQKIPGISESLAFKAKVVEEVSEQIETVVEAVTTVAETVEDVAEVIRKEAIEIENQAVELMQSEEKREELIENIIEYVTGNESSSSDGIKDESLELPAVDLKMPSSEDTTEIPNELQKEVSTQEEPEEKLPYVSPTEVLEVPKDSIIEPAVKDSLFDKFVNLFSKDDEHKVKIAGGGKSVGERVEPVEEELKNIIIKHDTESSKIDKINKPSTSTTVVADGKGLIDELTSPFSNGKEEAITKSVMRVKELDSDLCRTESEEQVNEKVIELDIGTPTFKEEKKGVFDKLSDFLTKGKEDNVLSETLKVPGGEERENIEKLSMDAIREAGNTSAESSVIAEPPSSANQPNDTNILEIYSINEDTADRSCKVAVVADTQSAAAVAAVVTHVDVSEEESLIQSNFVMVSSKEDIEGTPISDSAVPSLVEVPKLSSESSVSVPSETEEPLLEVKDKSLVDRLAELVSVDDKNTENLSQKDTVNQPNEVAEQSKPEMTFVDSDNIFVVKTKPSSGGDSGTAVESGQERSDAAVPVWQGFSRTGDSVKQEGKDIVVQLAPPLPKPEIDYGQSNPEDSDMYTTRS
ncbi:fap1 adhesin-like isoform X2 [Procambarus clarkii]